MREIPFRLALASALALLLPAAASARLEPDAELDKLLAGRVMGQPVDCLSLPNVTGNTIVEGRAIVYRIGTRLYVNVPPDGARQLRRDDIIVTRTFSTNLCRGDVIRLLDRTASIPHGFISLGQFVPYTKAATR